jgi:hypothetical protein
MEELLKHDEQTDVSDYQFADGDLSNFQEQGLDCELRISGKVSTLKKYFQSLSLIDPKTSENNRKVSDENLRFL